MEKHNHNVGGRLREPPYGRIAKQILKYLAMGVAIYIGCSSPTGTRRFLRNIKKEWKVYNTRKSLERLHIHKLVSYRKKQDGTVVVTITQKGKKKVHDWDIENLVIKKPAAWDGRWRIVAFDIAEQRRKGRNALRTMLRRLGFMQVQKSMFVCPYACRKEIRFLREFFSIPEKEVLYFSSDTFVNAHQLKRKFGL